MALAVAAWAVSCPEASAAEGFWRQAMPQKRVSADPDADYALAENNGPWLIMAASFNGATGEQEARELVHELRSQFNLPAYYYGMQFKLEDERPGRGVDDYGAPIRRRYQRGSQVQEHAVLVGEFPSIDDPEAQRLLARIKTMEPKTLQASDGETTSQSLAGVRQTYRYLKQRVGKKVTEGPMGHAFMARNPLMPKEYFAPRGVDPDVAKWNAAVEHSLLDCPGKYSVKVATFRGRTLLKSANDDVEDKPGMRAADADDPLIVGAQNAHALTVALREKGWEAYEFHDRQESYVAVGSFDEAEILPDGRLAPKTREAQIIAYTFGAASPAHQFEKATYQELGVNDAKIHKIELQEESIKQQFDRQFSNKIGDVTEGFHPKRLVGVPFDIQPQIIEAPKQSISSAYVRH
jgi:hypothetical protein